MSRRPERVILGLRLDLHAEHVRRRRIQKQRPIPDLLLVKSLIVLPRGQLHRVVLRLVGLDHDFPRPNPAPCAARRLCEQLERALRRPVVLRVQRDVREQDAHERHLRKIMSLHDHLRPDEDVRLLLPERGQDLLVAALRLRGVGVHPQDPRARELLQKILLDLLRPGLESRDIRRAALRTLRKLKPLIPAIVADELPRRPHLRRSRSPLPPGVLLPRGPPAQRMIRE